MILSLITLSICVTFITSQTDSPKPEWDDRGCPALSVPLPCMAKGFSCIHKDRTNVYKQVRARSWWHCGKKNLENISIYINPFLDSGKACLPATKCEYWTFRHHERKCYLLKSCCVKEAQGFQSGDQYCPGYDA